MADASLARGALECEGRPFFDHDWEGVKAERDDAEAASSDVRSPARGASVLSVTRRKVTVAAIAVLAVASACIIVALGVWHRSAPNFMQQLIAAEQDRVSVEQHGRAMVEIGRGACSNANDLARWQTGGAMRLDQDMHDCAHRCFGEPSCVSSCLVGFESYSQRCQIALEIWACARVIIASQAAYLETPRLPASRACMTIALMLSGSATVCLPRLVHISTHDFAAHVEMTVDRISSNRVRRTLVN